MFIFMTLQLKGLIAETRLSFRVVSPSLYYLHVQDKKESEIQETTHCKQVDNPTPFLGKSNESPCVGGKLENSKTCIEKGTFKISKIILVDINLPYTPGPQQH